MNKPDASEPSMFDDVMGRLDEIAAIWRGSQGIFGINVAHCIAALRVAKAKIDAQDLALAQKTARIEDLELAVDKKTARIGEVECRLNCLHCPHITPGWCGRYKDDPNVINLDGSCNGWVIL